MIVRSRAGNNGQQIGEFLDNLVGGGNEEIGMSIVAFRIADEEPAALLANPLHKPLVVGALEQRFDAIERIGSAAAGNILGRLRPLIDHGERQIEIGGDLLGAGFVEHLAQQLVGMHESKMQKRLLLGKTEGAKQGRRPACPASREATSVDWPYARACRRSPGRRDACPTLTAGLRLRRETHHQIEARRQFPNARTFERIKRHRHCVARLLVLKVFPDVVFLIARMALDVALGDELFFALHFDGKMNVRRASGVGNRFDGTEQIFTGGTREKSSEALEVFVTLVGVARLRVEVSPIVVALPYFDERVPHGLAARIQDAAAQPGDFSKRRRDGVVQDEQVIVSIQGQLVRIERPFRLGRRPDEFLGESARDGEQRGAEAEPTEEMTAVLEKEQLLIHILPFQDWLVFAAGGICAQTSETRKRK